MNKITILIAIGILLSDYYDGRNCKEKNTVTFLYSGEFICAPQGS